MARHEPRQLAGTLTILSLAAALPLAPRAVAQPEVVDIITGSTSSDFRNIRGSRIRLHSRSHLAVARFPSTGREPYLFGADLARFVLDYYEGAGSSILDGGPERAGVIVNRGFDYGYILSLNRGDTGAEPVVIRVNDQGATVGSSAC